MAIQPPHIADRLNSAYVCAPRHILLLGTQANRCTATQSNLRPMIGLATPARCRKLRIAWSVALGGCRGVALGVVDAKSLAGLRTLHCRFCQHVRWLWLHRRGVHRHQRQTAGSIFRRLLDGLQPINRQTGDFRAHSMRGYRGEYGFGIHNPYRETFCTICRPAEGVRTCDCNSLGRKTPHKKTYRFSWGQTPEKVPDRSPRPPVSRVGRQSP